MTRATRSLWQQRLVDEAYGAALDREEAAAQVYADMIERVAEVAEHRI